MYFKIISIFLSILIIGCSDKESHHAINLIEYLPKGDVGTVYTSYFTKTQNNNIVEKKTLIQKNKNCVVLNVELIKNNLVASKSKKELCVKNNKLYSGETFGNDIIVDLSNKYWYGYKMHVEGQDIKLKCQIKSIGNVLFDNKKYDSFTVECKAKKLALTFIYAKNLGLIKTIQSIDSFGVVGSVELKRIEAPALGCLEEKQ